MQFITINAFVINTNFVSQKFSYLLSQVGKGADQLPLAKHSLSNAPTSVNPSLHVWFTTDPKVVTRTSIGTSVKVTFINVPEVLPLKGVPGSPQSTTM